MALRRIPLQAYPDFTQQCELDGETYTLRFRWSERGAVWHLDLSTVDGVPIKTGIRLVTAFPLLRGNTHESRPPGELHLVDLRGLDGRAGLQDLGARYVLLYEEA